MATLADSYFPFDSGAGGTVTETQWRDIFGYMRGMTGGRNGVLRVGLKHEVFGDSSGRQVKLRTGSGWVQGHFGSTGVEKILPVNANTSGSTRKDRVVMRINFATNVVEYECVAGTATPPPLVQDTTKWEISLAVVTVVNGAATIAAGDVADSRQYVDEPHVTVMKLASPTRTSTTTLAVDTELVIPVSSSSLYIVDAFLDYTASTTGDLKFDFTAPSGASGELSSRGLALATAGATGDLDAAVAALGVAMTSGGAGAGTKVSARVTGFLGVGETAGDFTLRWAQNTSDATGTTLYAGSWLRITRAA